MPINWSTVKVSEAMDMAEEFVNQAAEPLEQTEIVATQARALADYHRLNVISIQWSPTLGKRRQITGQSDPV